MNIIEQVLSQVPLVAGFIRLSVVDVATGQILGSRQACADSSSPAPPSHEPSHELVAASTTQMLHCLEPMLLGAALDEDVEDVMITLSGHHHLLRLLPDLAGTDVYLLLTLDRSRSNLALARHQLLAFEAPLVT